MTRHRFFAGRKSFARFWGFFCGDCRQQWRKIEKKEKKEKKERKRREAEELAVREKKISKKHKSESKKAEKPEKSKKKSKKPEVEEKPHQKSKESKKKHKKSDESEDEPEKSDESEDEPETETVRSDDSHPVTVPVAATTTTTTNESDSDFELDKEDIKHLLESYSKEEFRELLQPYSKDQLVDLVCSAAHIGSSIYSAVVEAADRDVTHRKIFVYGLPWETTRDTLFGVFEGYGDIEECTVVIDKVTGKAKGFGFVMFKTRKGAREALKEPKKRILNRTATCQLASMGPAASGKGQDQAGPVKISFCSMANHGQIQQQQAQGQHVFNGGGMAASPFMLGNQYHPVYGTGMLGNPALAAAAGGYMYPMLASALTQGGFGSGALSHELLQFCQMGGIGEQGGGAGLSVMGSYFGGQSLPGAYSVSDTG